MERKSKPIPFNKNEEDLLNWAENRGKPFATYVKDLIREDMKKHDAYKKEDLKDLIKEVLSEMDIKNLYKSKQEDTDKTTKLSSKSINAYKNLLK